LAQAAVLAWDIDAIIDVGITGPTLIPRRTNAEKVIKLILARSAVLTRVRRALIRLHSTVSALPANVANTGVIVQFA
jgi:hypothetical protein